MTDTTTPSVCPNCQHPHHLPGTECSIPVHHGPSHWHLCLCLARPGAALSCPPQMACQGGTLGYSDIWYLQQGHSLSSADGVISPEVLTVGPVSVGYPAASAVVPAADRAEPEPSDSTQCSGEEGFCPEHGFHRNSLKQPGTPEPAADRAALRDRTTEEHRLALSDALGLGTGAPWDAIHDRVTELGLPPLDQDPVAQRLGLVAEHRAAVLEKAATAVAADTGFHIRYGAAVDYAEHYAALLRRMAAGSAAVDRVAAETPPAETERRLTRVREWATSDVVTARNGFGSGYREAQRDILDLIDGPGPAVEAQPGKDTETPQPKEA